MEPLPDTTLRKCPLCGKAFNGEVPPNQQVYALTQALDDMRDALEVNDPNVRLDEITVGPAGPAANADLAGDMVLLGNARAVVTRALMDMERALEQPYSAREGSGLDMISASELLAGTTDGSLEVLNEYGQLGDSTYEPRRRR